MSPLYFAYHQTGPQRSCFSSRGGRVDQRKGNLKVSYLSALAIFGKMARGHDVCTFLPLTEHRPRTSSTASLGASSGRTTTPPTSRAASRVSPTSTWPPSAACSTTTCSTPSSLDAHHCSTSPPCGPSPARLLPPPRSLTGAKAAKQEWNSLRIQKDKWGTSFSYFFFTSTVLNVTCKRSHLSLDFKLFTFEKEGKAWNQFIHISRKIQQQNIRALVSWSTVFKSVTLTSDAWHCTDNLRFAWCACLSACVCAERD